MIHVPSHMQANAKAYIEITGILVIGIVSVSAKWHIVVVPVPATTSFLFIDTFLRASGAGKGIGGVGCIKIVDPLFGIANQVVKPQGAFSFF